MDKRKDFQTRMGQELDRIARELDELLSSAETRAKQEYENLPGRVEKAQKQLRGLREAGGDAWEELKPGLEKSWRELRDSLDRARQRLRRDPSKNSE